MRRSTFRVAALGSLVALVGCSGAEDAVVQREGTSAPEMDLMQVLVPVGSLRLEENARSVTVVPDVTPVGSGGFLVADRREQQVRMYDAAGSLRFATGTRGDGPEEFRTLQTAVVGPSGHLFALEMSGRLTRMDGTGRILERFSIPGIQRAFQLGALGDSSLLLSARPEGDLTGPRLHILDLPRREIVKSFFAPVPGATSRVAAVSAGWVGFDVFGDTVAATFSVSDTLYYFSSDGELLGQWRIPSAEFSLPAGDPDPEIVSQPQRRAEWLASFDLVDRPYIMEDRDVLLLLQRVVPERALGRRYRLLRSSPTGSGRWVVEDVPRLLAIRSDSLFLQDPDSEYPNEWLVATVRGH